MHVSRHCIYTYVCDTGSCDSIGKEELSGIVRVKVFFIAVHPHTKTWISGQLSENFVRSCDVGVDRCNVPSIPSLSLEINFDYVSVGADKSWFEISFGSQLYCIFLTCCLLVVQLCAILPAILQNDQQPWISTIVRTLTFSST